VDIGVIDDDAPFAAQRLGCTYPAGALPSDTFGPSMTAKQIPIDTFIIVMHENRSFDHYFQGLAAFGQPDADVGVADASFVGGNSSSVTRFHQPALCFGDTNHSWNGQHTSWDGGKNDGFALANANAGDPTGVRALGYYDATDLPFYYGMANTFSISDRYFCPTLTSTGPNRLYLYAATSNGGVFNNGASGIPVSSTIFAQLNSANVSWTVYSTGTYSFEAGIFTSLPLTQPNNFKRMTDFYADTKAGTLPHVVFLYSGSDEHPPADPQKAQADVAAIYTALAASPQWLSSALFLTYDENGGLYDHVAPPKACAPDSVAPKLAAGDAPGDFAQYGFRVPLIIASAWARPHYVSHVVNDHTSILRLIELRFQLKALTARDANANGLLDMFDFSAPSFLQAPALPAAPIDPKRAC
jgi:phospholipase C